MKFKFELNQTIRATLRHSISSTVNVAAQSLSAFTVSQRALSHLRASGSQYWFFHPLKQPHEHKFCMRLLLAASALVWRHMMGPWTHCYNPVCPARQTGRFKEIKQGSPTPSGLWRTKAERPLTEFLKITDWWCWSVLGMWETKRWLLLVHFFCWFRMIKCFYPVYIPKVWKRYLICAKKKIFLSLQGHRVNRVTGGLHP